MELLNTKLISRLIIAAVLGLVIGLERELKRKPLGLKTSAVISIISCLITIVSIESAYTFPRSDLVEIRMDPLRLAAQIVSGVGFLGAGVIMHRNNDDISGLTTAAIIWGSAGIGVATGAGFYIEATVGVILILVSVEFIPFLATKLVPKRLDKINMIIRINIKKEENIDYVMDALMENNYRISHTRIKDLVEDSCHLLEIKVRVHKDRTIKEIYDLIKSIKGVKAVEVCN